MTEKKSVSYFVLADNMTHIVKNGVRMCTGESDSNVKYDPRANLFATYCSKCQS
ncbi:MAG: hypothetical protein GKS07_10565 [Nitrosopumilus sp.]|nr:MAG: hypothetical protein GKS07_10565 [Nitrosopumilus sp.]